MGLAECREGQGCRVGPAPLERDGKGSSAGFLERLVPLRVDFPASDQALSRHGGLILSSTCPPPRTAVRSRVDGQDG